MFSLIVETRSCEGFAKLEQLPDTGTGPLVGTFEMRADTLVFSAAPSPAPAAGEAAAAN